MKDKHRSKLIFFLCSLMIISLLVSVMVLWVCSWKRKVKIENVSFTESSRELQNPNRGFYHLYSFQITDEEQDYPGLIAERYQHDTDTKLTLVQICLKSYRQNAITREGLANIEALFDALGTLDKQLIVRFTYDGEGQNERYEPESLDIILTHMEQLSHILQEYSKEIFSLQGLFIGNWGEMNGTQYNSDEDLRILAQKLERVTDSSTYLAVRMPSQWRSIMQVRSWQTEDTPADSLAGRLGLFNDGMLGNESDYGTYETEKDKDADTVLFPRMKREEELEFQDGLCRKVPNGGEVINDNCYNDFRNAVKDFNVMHVTYLNQDYDREVMDKWAHTVITKDGCFNGMDGLSYIERHLGYRLVLVDSSLSYRSEGDILTAGVTLKNVGFAPLYKETKVRMILYDETNDQVLFYPIDQDLQSLAGGNEAEDTLTISADIPFRDLTEKEYGVYFSIVDEDTGELILLANEEDEEQYGYRIGTVSQE